MKLIKERFTIKQFNEKYIDDNACLHEIFLSRYSHLKNCPECNGKFSYYKVKARKCYSCAYCGHQLHPLADTIFHKSSTNLKNWFYAIFLFSTFKNGVSAKELERQLGVTYKCAYRIAKQKVKTDEYKAYNSLKKLGYKHDKVDHGKDEYVKGNTHTNNLEGFWSQLKRSINGTYHSVSSKYL